MQSTDPFFRYFVISVGLSDTSGHLGGFYSANLKNQYGPARSYNLVKIDTSSGNILFHRTYDIFGYPNQYESLLADDLNNSNSSVLIVMYTFDEPKTHRLRNQSLPAAVYRCGGSPAIFGNNSLFHWRGAYLLIGFCGQNKSQEFYSGLVDSSKVAWISKEIYVNSSNSLFITNTNFSGHLPTPEPTYSPSAAPTFLPSTIPSINPSEAPTPLPSVAPSIRPTICPSIMRTITPTMLPSKTPSATPSLLPSMSPSIPPTWRPTVTATFAPSKNPTSQPSFFPSYQPLSRPSRKPFHNPSKQPTGQPHERPSEIPSIKPQCLPSQQPVKLPSRQPVAHPSIQPSNQPRKHPSKQPQLQPSIIPSRQPSAQPYWAPTQQPSRQPFNYPTSNPTLWPTSQPRRHPTTHPSKRPYVEPTFQPVSVPSSCPDSVPSYQPTEHPRHSPTVQPIVSPSCQPDIYPTTRPSQRPSYQPISKPSQQPFFAPSQQPQNKPSTQPVITPTLQPNFHPLVVPSLQPRSQPTKKPSSQPFRNPSRQPRKLPTQQPQEYPSGYPSLVPRSLPSLQPTREPSGQPAIFRPSQQPRSQPSKQPSSQPTIIPSGHPSEQPSAQPLIFPSSQPDVIPSKRPTKKPSCSPTTQPRRHPTNRPTVQPNLLPSDQPLCLPSSFPSVEPSHQPTEKPIQSPTGQPVVSPTNNPASHPTIQPSVFPGCEPTSKPSHQPSYQPLFAPTTEPSLAPSKQPGKFPSLKPSLQPAMKPSNFPSSQPIRNPTIQPNIQPTSQPSVSPTGQPILAPSMVPSAVPTFDPSNKPSRSPFHQPSRQPNRIPSHEPSRQPQHIPSESPSKRPSKQPSRQPTLNPSCFPSSLPSQQPGTKPSAQPTIQPSILPTKQPVIFPSKQPISTPTKSPAKKPSSQPLEHPSDQPRSNPSLQPIKSPYRCPSLIPTCQPSTTPLQKLSPQGFIEIATPMNSSYINPQSKLLLKATVRSSTSCTSNWAIDDSTINLFPITLISGRELVMQNRTTIVYLYLSAYSLRSSRKYSFTCSCGVLAAKISVVTNSPPTGGSFAVSPLFGIEVTTSFTFLAPAWLDSDLPLRFQFGYIDPSTGKNTAVMTKSFSNHVSTVLPAGATSSHFTIDCVVLVVDTLSTFSTLENKTIVFPTDMTSRNNFIIPNLQSPSIGVIGIIGSLLNKANCSGHEICAQLNRKNCSSIDFTCGDCMEGYIGAIGPGNTPCQQKWTFSTTLTECRLTDDCPRFQFCNISLGFCEDMPKECPNACSSNGICQFVDSYTGHQVSRCKLVSADCSAKCSCISGYGGSSCSMRSELIQLHQYQRGQLLQSLIVLPIYNFSTELFVSRSSALLTITSNPFEIGQPMAIEALSYASNLLHTAAQAGVEYENVTDILQSIDRLADSPRWDNFSTQMVATIQSFISLTTSQLFDGLRVENVFNNFRVVCASLLNADQNLTVPVSEFAQLRNPEQSYVHFRKNSSVLGELKASVVEIDASLIATNDALLSNPLQIFVSDLNKLSFPLVIAMRNIAPLSQFGSMSFSTTCTARMAEIGSTFNYSCTSSGVQIVHNCLNKIGVLKSFCPVFLPSCRVLASSLHTEVNCSLVNHNISHSLCDCRMSRSVDRRLLQDGTEGIVEQSGWLQLASITTLTASNFADTFSAAKISPEEITSKSSIVVAMFGTLWCSVLSIVAVFCWRRRFAEKIRCDNQMKQNDQIACDDVDVIVEYIMKALPSVFQLQHTSAFRHSKLFEELTKSHRYFSLLFDGPKSPGWSYALKAARFLTIAGMLMFLSALFYDLHSPVDDGSCANFATMGTCLARKSPLDSRQSYCEWTTTTESSSKYFCRFNVPTLSVQAILVIVLFVSVITAAFLRPIEYLFRFLASPNPDSAKLRGKTFKAGNEAPGNAKLVGFEMMDIPTHTLTAQRLARSTSAKVNPRILSTARQKYSQFRTSEPTIRIDGDSISEINKLSREVFQCRERISDSKRKDFDFQWGVLSAPDRSLRPEVLKIALAEIEKVQLIGAMMVGRLRLAPDNHIGLEILHLFFQDLLGRDTPAGRIFRKASQKEFKRHFFVSLSAQYGAIFVLVAANVFFAFYCILYAAEHDASWQWNYLVSIVAQLLVEVFINETLEVLWLNILGPNLVVQNVQRACEVMVSLISRTRTEQQGEVRPSQEGFNAAEYFHVSRKVAIAFQTLFEAKIVLAYSSILPEEVGKKWQRKTFERRGLHLLEVTVVLINILQYLASMPDFLQRIFVRSGQPLLVAALVMVFYALVESPWFALLGAIVPLGAAGFVLLSRTRRSSSPVTPFSSVVASKGGTVDRVCRSGSLELEEMTPVNISFEVNSSDNFSVSLSEFPIESEKSNDEIYAHSKSSSCPSLTSQDQIVLISSVSKSSEASGSIADDVSSVPSDGSFLIDFPSDDDSISIIVSEPSNETGSRADDVSAPTSELFDSSGESANCFANNFFED